MPVLTRDQWLALRRKGIGGSDIAAIMGVSKWKTPLDVYYEKVEGRQIEENKYMRAGRKLEAAVADYFADNTGALVHVPPDQLYRHSKKPLFIASPDRFYEASGTNNVLECKTSQKDVLEPEPEWFCQLQWYLGVMSHLGIEGGAIAWLVRGVDDGYKFYERMPDYIAEMQETAEKFWRDHIEKRVPPEPRTESDIRQLFPSHVAGKIVEADNGTFAVYQMLASAKEDRKKVEKVEAELAERIKLVMRDAEALTFGGEVICTFKKDKDGKTFDAKAFAEKNPATYEKYCVPRTGARKLLVK